MVSDVNLHPYTAEAAEGSTTSDEPIEEEPETGPKARAALDNQGGRAHRNRGL